MPEGNIFEILTAFSEAEDRLVEMALNDKDGFMCDTESGTLWLSWVHPGSTELMDQWDCYAQVRNAPEPCVLVACSTDGAQMEKLLDPAISDALREILEYYSEEEEE